MKYIRPLALFALIGLTASILITQNNIVPTATADAFAAFQACDAAFEADSTACGVNNPECSSQAVVSYGDCVFAIRETPDFCSAARARAQQCQYTYDPLTDFINFMNCTTASGVQYCE